MEALLSRVRSAGMPFSAASHAARHAVLVESAAAGAVRSAAAGVRAVDSADSAAALASASCLMRVRVGTVPVMTANTSRPSNALVASVARRSQSHGGESMALLGAVHTGVPSVACVALSRSGDSMALRDENAAANSPRSLTTASADEYGSAELWPLGLFTQLPRGSTGSRGVGGKEPSASASASIPIEEAVSAMAVVAGLKNSGKFDGFGPESIRLLTELRVLRAVSKEQQWRERRL